MREAEAQASAAVKVPGGVKRVKNVLLVLGSNTSPRVVDHHLGLPSNHLGANGDTDSAGAGLHGVADEVHEYLLDGHRIDQEQGELWCQGQCNARPTLLSVMACDVDGRADDLIEIGWPAVAGFLLGEVQHALDDARAALGVRDDVVQTLASDLGSLATRVGVTRTLRRQANGA